MPDGIAGARPRPRERIIQAARRLVAEGGYDAVQVQAVVELANVSSRTIYEHFPSLDSLILTAVTEPFDELARFLGPAGDGSDGAAEVHRLITALTETVTANRSSTVAVLRALLSGKPDVAEQVPRFANMLETLFTSAISPNPTARDRETAKFLQGIWFSAIVVWATGPGVDMQLADIMHEAARTLLPGRVGS